MLQIQNLLREHKLFNLIVFFFEVKKKFMQHRFQVNHENDLSDQFV